MHRIEWGGVDVGGSGAWVRWVWGLGEADGWVGEGEGLKRGEVMLGWSLRSNRWQAMSGLVCVCVNG